MKLACEIPHKVGVAFSGGVDSLAAALFLKAGRRDVTLFHFNHGCEFSNQIENGCKALANVLELPIVVTSVTGTRQPKQSLEEFWRRERYAFLKSQPVDIVTAHHLDDAVETWVWSSLHGDGKVIPVRNQNIIRPFLLAKKAELTRFVNTDKYVPVDDPYNYNLDLTRNYIRANMMAHVKFVNPGIDKVVRKKYLQK